MLNWIKLEDGCIMPDYGVPVIWETEDYNYFVRAIDKDDGDWWNGNPECEGRSWGPKCIHYAHINPSCDDDLPREAEKYFNDEQNDTWDEIWESLDFYPGDVTLKTILDKYTISRK